MADSTSLAASLEYDVSHARHDHDDYSSRASSVLTSTFTQSGESNQDDKDSTFGGYDNSSVYV
jgi:hypothetical protein